MVGTAFYYQKDTGQAANAIRWLKDSVAIKPNAEAYYFLGILHGEANQGPTAVDYLERAKKIAFDEETKLGKPPAWWIMDALYKLGEIHKQLGNYPAAREAWNAWVVRKPPAGAKLTAVLQDLATTLTPR